MAEEIGNRYAHQPESRVKKTLLNARVNLIFYLLTLILSFFSRKIFLDCLGADFIGLTGTLQNLLGFLNLAELGIASAIAYLLYKPIFEGDRNKINEIISVMGYLYRWIGLTILGCGCLLAFFIPIIFPTQETDFSYKIIYLAYFSFLGSSLIGYFINYRQNLLAADQKNYIIVALYQGMAFVKSIVQMACAYYTKSYVGWIIIEFGFGIIYSIILNWRINKTYPWLKTSAGLGKMKFSHYPDVMKKTKQLFVHHINGYIQFQCTPFLTYLFTSVQMVAYLDNYTIIINKIINLLSTVFNSMMASVGNLIAEGKFTKIIEIFWEFIGLKMFISGLLVFVAWESFEEFILIWLGSQYILSKTTLLLILLGFYINASMDPIVTFIYGYGLFKDIWASIVQTIIFLIGAVVLGYFYKVNGILCATALSLFFRYVLWNPYFLFKEGFKLSIYKFWPKCILLNIFNAISMFLASEILGIFNPVPHIDNFIEWLLFVIYLISLYSIIAAIIYGLFFRESKTMILRILKKL